MPMSYSITFYFKGGDFEKVNAEDEDAAKQKVWNRLLADPSCCANIIIAEYDQATPHKQSVKIDRYENKGGRVVQVPY